MREPLGRGTRLVRAALVLVTLPWLVVALLVHGPGLPVVAAVNAVTGQRADDPPRGAKTRAAEDCAAVRGRNRAPVTGHTDPRGTMRVFAIGYHLDLDHAASYTAYRTAMRCLVEEFVEPHRRPGQPTMVVFPEDVGLPLVALGRRGATARAQAADASPLRAVSPDVPLALGGILGQLNLAYGPQIAAYQARLGPVDPRKQVLLAATDTFARGFSRTFSEIARDYGLYVVAGNNQARYRVTTDPAQVALFADPAAQPARRAYVATSQRVPNTTFLWGPEEVRPDAPDFERNLLFRNEKVPLTDIEKDLLAIDEGPATGPAARRNAAGVEVEGFRFGFATSLPAFAYGYPFGRRPEGFEPCADHRVSYAACMDELGVEVMIQADANPGYWTNTVANGSWQPLEWMSSTWRAVADPTVRFRYNVTPMMTGNLADLPFDGQSSITMRGADQPGRHYVGNARTAPGDLPEYARYAGPKREFLALAPWAAPDGPRTGLTSASERLSPGSGDRLENRYTETAIYADLVPADRDGEPAG